MMKKLGAVLAALLLAVPAPVLAEEADYDMAGILRGDWFLEGMEDFYLLFDGTDLFYYSTNESYYYGTYSYIGDDTFLLKNDVDEEYFLTLNDDISLSLEGVDGLFQCHYNYSLMDFPYTDEGIWLSESGADALAFDLYGEFEFENEENYFYGTYTYLGGGDYQLDDTDGNTYMVSVYEDGSISMEGIEGYFWLQDENYGDDPFADARDEALAEQAEMGSPWDADPIPLLGSWYQQGDTATTPIILEDGTYSCEDSLYTGTIETGTWTMDTVAEYLEEGETGSSVYISMEGDDGMPSGWNPVTMAGNRLLYSSLQDTYFVHESVIGTEEGEQLCLMGDLMCADWEYDGDEKIWIEFYGVGNTVVGGYFDEEGSSVEEEIGTWYIQDNTVTVIKPDESTESFTLPADTIHLYEYDFVKTVSSW